MSLATKTYFLRRYLCPAVHYLRLFITIMGFFENGKRASSPKDVVDILDDSPQWHTFDFPSLIYRYCPKCPASINSYRHLYRKKMLLIMADEPY